MLTKRFFVLFVIVIFNLSSCGYSLVGHVRSLPDTIQSIAVPFLLNKTSEPNLEIILSNVIREEFILDGRLKVKDEKEADLIVKGEVRNYTLKPVAFDAENTVTEYWVELTAWIEVHDRVNDSVIAKQAFTGKWDFKVDQDITISEPQRVEAIQEASKILAQKIISIAIEGF